MSELFLVRHGESKANVSCTVVCTLEEGVQPRWGLTTRGEQQALAAGDELLRRIHSSHNASELIIVSSPFSRAKQTALAIQRRTGAATPITEDSRIVERFFGSQFELKNASDVYYRMLEGDTKSLLDSPIEGAEAAVDVASRVSAAMADATNSANGRSVVIVSHGDPLQIMEASARAPPGEELENLRKSHEHKFANAEVFGPVEFAEGWSAENFAALKHRPQQ